MPRQHRKESEAKVKVPWKKIAQAALAREMKCLKALSWIAQRWTSPIDEPKSATHARVTLEDLDKNGPR